MARGITKTAIRAGTLGLALWAPSCTRKAEPVRPAAAVVEVVEDDAAREARYTITSGDCRITWTVFRTPVNLGVIRHHAVCGLDLRDQAPLIEKVLARVMESDAAAGKFRTLMWGRLYPDDAKESTLSARLAVAAMRSDDWDASRGRPNRGEINAWTRKTMEGAHVYEELKPVFAARGLEIRLGSVEKVLVQQAGKLDFFRELSGAGVGVADRVPFDCQTWFSVKSAQ
jgi:hypothetical protein